MLPTNLSAVDQKFLQDICDQAWPESQRLEFKRELPRRDDEGRGEFLKDVSGLANADGGDLVFGINEAQGCASGIGPLTQESADATVRRLGQVIDGGIEPRISGLNFHRVSLGNGFALVLRVPRSFNGPHCYQSTHGKRFAIRTGTHTTEMSYSQLRTAFVRTGSLLDNAKEFRERRVSLIRSGRTWAPLQAGPTFVLHVIPVESMTEQFGIDILKIHDSYDAFYFRDWGGASRTLNLDGVVIHTGRVDGSAVPAYTQVFRSGAIEAVRYAGRLIDDKKIIPGLTIATYVRDAIEKLLPGISRVGVTGPVVLGAALLSTSGYEFGGGSRYDGPIPPADRADLVLPEEWIDRAEAPPSVDDIARPQLDILWQCFGRERCPYFDERGEFITKI